jgi:hypothetical protein
MDRDLSSLLQRIQSCRTIKDFADASIDLVGNPMLIFDLNMRVLESTDIELDDNHYNHLKDHHYPDTDLTQDRQWRREMSLLWQRKDANIEEYCGRKFLSKMLRINDSVVGQITVGEHFRPFSEDDLTIIELISYPLAMAVYSRLALSAPRNSELDYCLEYLLDGNQLTDEQIQLRAEMASWQPGPLFYVLCASSLENGTEYQRHQFEHVLQKNDILLRYRSYAVLLLSRKRSLSPGEAGFLREQLTFHDVTGGISPPFSSLSQLAQRFQQACSALEIGTRVDGDRQLYCYEDYIEYAFIRECQKVADPLSFVMPGLLELSELDRRQNLELLKTLRIYLYHGRSIQKTADELSIHRNTVSYRIGKCLDYLNLELGSGRHLMRLSQSIQILEYIDRSRYFT